MDFDKLARKAQQIYTERGGADAAKGDAHEVEEILKGDGSFIEKAKEAAKALKEPGEAEAPPASSQSTPPVEPPGPPSGTR